jgi:hypothetical protein
MKRYIYTFVLLVFAFMSNTTWAQASLDTTILKKDKIICYRSNTPGYGNYLPPIITDYITILDTHGSMSNESPEHKVDRMTKFVTDFSVSESKSSDQELFLGYIAHLIICNPHSTNIYSDMVIEEITELTQSSKKNIRANALLVQKLII